MHSGAIEVSQLVGASLCLAEAERDIAQSVCTCVGGGHAIKVVDFLQIIVTFLYTSCKICTLDIQ